MFRDTPHLVTTDAITPITVIKQQWGYFGSSDLECCWPALTDHPIIQQQAVN